MKSKLSKFIFVHIMKTGGTTFCSILKRRYGKKYLLDTTYKTHRKKGCVYLTRKSRCPKNYKKAFMIHGHFPASKYKHLGWPMITFLRDPVERIISQYSFWSTNNHSSGLTIREFSELYSNHMTYVTNGDLSQFAFVGLLEYFDESLRRLKQVLNLNINLKYKRLNVGHKKVKVSKQDRRYIRELNQKDYKLYNKIIKRYNK